MALEDFFRDGNRIAAVGSYVWLRKQAADFDFALFTHKGKNPFSCKPEESAEVRQFLEEKFGRIYVPLNHAGRNYSGESAPYDLEHVNAENPKISGYFLTGRIFPDSEFLKGRFRTEFGDDFVVQLWHKLSGYIAGFSALGIRMDKRHKDMGLLLAAAGRVAESHPEIRHIVDDYSNSYTAVTRLYLQRQLDFKAYHGVMNSKIPLFVESVSSFLKQL